MKFINKIICLFFLTFSSVIAEDVVAYKVTSSNHPVALVELYTSQGCSSCPPADKWLATLEESGLTQDKVIPLALHVDYWDYIGWKDEFAQTSFAQRQRKFRQLDRSTSVYTPQIMFNGDDVRKLRFSQNIKQLKNKKAPVKFELIAKVSNRDRLQVNISFVHIDNEAQKSHLVIVLAENNLKGDIKAGENKDRVLRHEHVVRLWKNLGVLRKNMAITLAIKEGWQQESLELIAFVETADLRMQQVVRLGLK